jgi:hypothetical protein
LFLQASRRVISFPKETSSVQYMKTVYSPNTVSSFLLNAEEELLTLPQLEATISMKKFLSSSLMERKSNIR